MNFVKTKPYYGDGLRSSSRHDVSLYSGCLATNVEAT